MRYNYFLIEIRMLSPVGAWPPPQVQLRQKSEPGSLTDGKHVCSCVCKLPAALFPIVQSPLK